MGNYGMAALLGAALDDHRARIERNTLRSMLPFLRKRYRGELLVDVGPDGSVVVSESTSAWRRDSRFQTLYVDDLMARRLLREAAELGLT